MTCKTCKKQYVGETKLRCSDRIQAHFNTIRSKGQSWHLKQADHNDRNDVQVHILFYPCFPRHQKACHSQRWNWILWLHRLCNRLPIGISTMDKPRVLTKPTKVMPVKKNKRYYSDQHSALSMENFKRIPQNKQIGHFLFIYPSLG